MLESYKIVYKGGQGEIEEKKSRFIATVEPVESEEEAIAFIEKMKKKYWDARHNCSAYVIGERNQIQRCSDDGEPSQTAGRPMLDVILGEGIHNVAVVVTRYFGGTLLGTGGLVRAYSAATKEGIEHSVVVSKNLGSKYEIDTDYNGIGKIQYIIGQMGLVTLDTVYTDAVKAIVLVPEKDCGAFEKKVAEATFGRAGITMQDKVYYGEAGGEVIVFGNQSTS